MKTDVDRAPEPWTIIGLKLTLLIIVKLLKVIMGKSFHFTAANTNLYVFYVLHLIHLVCLIKSLCKRLCCSVLDNN